MTLLGLIDEDFVNYKKVSMVLQFPKCTLKCNKPYGRPICQNTRLVLEKGMEIDAEELVMRYLRNPITEAVVMQGLEPFDTYDDLKRFINKFRTATQDDIVIYTGYNKEEIADQIAELSQYPNIIIKFGRYVPNQEPHYDEVLGVKLASDNQYAERIS